MENDKIEIPDFLKELSVQMNEDPRRATGNQFWQVRCKRFYVTEKGYNEHHFELIGEEGSFYRSDADEGGEAAQCLWDNHNDYCRAYCDEHTVCDDDSLEEWFVVTYEITKEAHYLPDGVSVVFMQEIEDVVWTGLTESAALYFIKRKQHDYPKLYTYVESAYWSPQFRLLQDWIKSLTK